jgi:hypothetical protein
LAATDRKADLPVENPLVYQSGRKREVRYSKRHFHVTLTWSTAGSNIGCKYKKNIEIETALFLAPICASFPGMRAPGAYILPGVPAIGLSIPGGCRYEEHQHHQSLLSAAGIKNTWGLQLHAYCTSQGVVISKWKL